MPNAFKVSVRKDAIALFEKHGIFNEAELHARYEINMENLVKKIQIESRVLANLAANHIVPTAIRYQNILIQNVKGLKDILPDEYADMAAEEIRDDPQNRPVRQGDPRGRLPYGRCPQEVQCHGRHRRPGQLVTPRRC